MPNISINTDNIFSIVKKMEYMQEELMTLVSDMDKEIEMAELDGWSDNTFFKFKDDYEETKYNILNASKKIEENHLLYLKKILRNTEELS